MLLVLHGRVVDGGLFLPEAASLEATYFVFFKMLSLRLQDGLFPRRQHRDQTPTLRSLYAYNATLFVCFIAPQLDATAVIKYTHTH